MEKGSEELCFYEEASFQFQDANDTIHTFTTGATGYGTTRRYVLLAGGLAYILCTAT